MKNYNEIIVMSKVKVYLYIRISTSTQIDSYSLEVKN